MVLTRWFKPVANPGLNPLFHAAPTRLQRRCGVKRGCIFPQTGFGWGTTIHNSPNQQCITHNQMEEVGWRTGRFLASPQLVAEWPGDGRSQPVATWCPPRSLILRGKRLLAARKGRLSCAKTLHFRLILGQYSNFRGPQCIPRWYMDIQMTGICCYSSQLDSGLVYAFFVAFISRYRYRVLRVRVSGRGFLLSPGLPIRPVPFFFHRNGWKIWVPLILNGFRTRFRGCPANVMSVAMLWKARLCFLSIVVRITFEQKTKSC